MLAQLNGAVVATAVTQRLRADGERGLLLARQIQETALAARVAAIELWEVVAALNEARVAVLVYDPNVRYQGRLGEEGRLQAGGATRGGPGSVVHEPRLTERIVERWLGIDARVMPVEGAAADVLAEAGGVTALLRW